MAAPGKLDGGKSWSELDLDDLERGMRIGVSVEVLADFLMRDVDEIRRKALELGILPKVKRTLDRVLNERR
jgi:hypothetical protein